MSYDDYKWKKRKYYIRINCWIIIAILTAILCFMFPIISNAAPSSVPVPSPSSDPAPDGYYWFDECLPVGEEYLYTDTTVDVSSIPDTYYNPITNDLDLLYFDHDLTNGEILIEQDSWDHVYNWYEPVYNNNGSVSWVYGDGYISDLSNYVLNTDGRLYLFDSNYKEATFTSSSFGIYDLGSNDDSVEASAKYRHHYVMSWLSLSGYNNVYYFKHGGSAYTVGYPSSVGIGTYQADTPHYSEILYYYKPYGVAHVFMSNFNNIYCTSESLRGGSSVYITDSDNNRESQIYGSPHHQILNNYRVEEEEITYPDGSGGDDSNNLYMRTADWQFNIPKYWGSSSSTLVKPQYTQNWGDGNIIFYGLLNDYQKANASHFDINFKFTIFIKGYHFSDVQSDVGGWFYGNYVGTGHLPLTNFIQGNNSHSFNVSDLFDLCVNPAGNTITDKLETIKQYNSIRDWNWTITCEAFLTSSSGDSGSIVEKYDFITQISKENSNTITDNNNPYFPDDSDGSSEPNDNNPNDPNNPNYSNGNGGININNNPNITITNNNDNNFNPINNIIPDGDGGTDENGDNLLTWIIKKLFGYIDALIGGVFESSGLNDNNDVSSQNSLVGDTLGNSDNGFLSFLNSTFTFIPQGMWNVLQYFFTVSIVILIIAFLIRIILDIL